MIPKGCFYVFFLVYSLGAHILAPGSLSAADFDLATGAIEAQSDRPINSLLSFDSTGRPIIVGEIDAVPGLPLSFRFDSGASDSVIYDTTALKLVLGSTPYRSREVYTANGYERRPTYIVGGFSALGASIKVDRTISLRDPADLSAVGLIGVDVFRQKILLLDAKARQARLIKAEELTDFALQEIEGKPVAGGSIAIKVTIGGVDIPALVDTGAEKTIMNSAAIPLIKRHLGEGIRRQDGPMRSIVNNDIAATADPYDLSQIMLGQEVLENVVIYKADLPIFVLLGAKKVPALILGMDLLADRTLAFDFQRFRLFLGERH